MVSHSRGRWESESLRVFTLTLASRLSFQLSLRVVPTISLTSVAALRPCFPCRLCYLIRSFVRFPPSLG